MLFLKLYLGKKICLPVCDEDIFLARIISINCLLMIYYERYMLNYVLNNNFYTVMDHHIVTDLIINEKNLTIGR